MHSVNLWYSMNLKEMKIQTVLIKCFLIKFLMTYKSNILSGMGFSPEKVLTVRIEKTQ